MNSRVVAATVRHERLSPVAREFSYPLRVLVLDLDELDLLGWPLVWGHNRFGLYSLRDSDYLENGPPEAGGLRKRLARLLSRSGRAVPDMGRVLLATCPRIAGYVFNPVSFWMAFTPGPDERFLFAVAEVNNTFGEKHAYVLDDPENLDDPDGDPASFPLRFRRPKAFHVSPFNDMRGEYAFTLADLRTGLDLGVDLWRDDQPVLRARLWSETPGDPATPGALLASLATHPFVGGLTYARILRQAAGLYLTRRLAVFSKPDPSNAMTLRSPDFNPRGRGFLDNLRAEATAAADRVAQKATLAFFSSLRCGSLRLTLPDGRTRTMTGPLPPDACGLSGPLQAELVIRDPAFYRRIALGGDIGFGDAYVDGLWDSPNLPRLMELLAANNNRMSLWRGLGLPGADGFDRLASLTRSLRGPLGFVGGFRNDRQGARRNIHAHYDLSNEMFELFLDPTMAYSCAWHEELECGLPQGHEEEVAELERAQMAKFQRIVRKLGLTSRHRLLEIGCGWGGLIVHCVKATGCRAVGLTISKEQRDHAIERVRREGLEDLIEIRLQDYRDARNETFDRIVSVEMLEAVGHEFHPAYFRALDRLLAPGGRALVQVITIADQRYETYRRSGDWIRKRIFPGGLLPSLARISEVTARHTSLVIRDVEDIGKHYARTLAIWRSRFLARGGELEILGFDRRFQRAWDYYFSYCLGGFALGQIGDAQIVFERPGLSGA